MRYSFKKVEPGIEDLKEVNGNFSATLSPCEQLIHTQPQRSEGQKQSGIESNNVYGTLFIPLRLRVFASQ